jgi:hypothetical protein
LCPVDNKIKHKEKIILVAESDFEHCQTFLYLEAAFSKLFKKTEAKLECHGKQLKQFK